MHINEPRNARFWEYINGDYVKLTLRPGQSLSWSTGYRTEEGWHSEGAQWTHTGDGVSCQSGTDGVDCDGRLSTHCDSFVPLDKLRERPDAEGLGILFPQWEKIDGGQRDYAAEAAGY